MTDLPPARILECSPSEYHDLPGFSASLAKVMISKSALHAKDAHDRQLERIADDADDEEDVPADKQERLDRGNILHALVLGVGKRVDEIPLEHLASNGAASTKAAKDFIATSRKAGRIPVKPAKLEVHRQVANALKARLSAIGHTLDGRSELAVEWWEPTPHGPVQCRCMMDHVLIHGLPLDTFGIVQSHDGPPMATIYDLKTTPDAHPDRCERTADGLLYAIQAAAYPRALTALYPRLGGRIDFRFLWCEHKRPYAIWDPPVLDGPFREIGERWWRRAVNAWGEGLATGRWPDYRTPDRVEMRAPMWRLKQDGYTPEEM